VKLLVHDAPTKPERARIGMGVALATHGTVSPLVTPSFPSTPFTSIRSALVRRTAQTCPLDRPRPLTTTTTVTPVGDPTDTHVARTPPSSKSCAISSFRPVVTW
jgi:hypothetical protein